MSPLQSEEGFILIEMRRVVKLLDLLSKGIVIGDGAVGTLLHSHGLQSSFEELNVSDPDLIISIHKHM